MDKYERNISLRTIFLTIVRRYKTILLFFIPIALITLIFTQFVMTKTYQSTVRINSNTIITTQTYQGLQLQFKNETFINGVADKLKTEDIKPSNGNEITVSEIKNSLSFGTLGTNVIYFDLYYQSTDSSVVQPILKAATSYFLEGQDVYKIDPSGVSVAAKNSSENKYLLIGIAAGVVVACGVAFIDEIMSDEIYDSKDMADYGIPAFDLKVK